MFLKTEFKIKTKPQQCCAHASKVEITSGVLCVVCFFLPQEKFLVLQGASAKDNVSQGAKHSARIVPK